MSCKSKCRFLNAAQIATHLSDRGISCSERAVREMITKKRLPVFASPFNGVHQICEKIIDHMLEAEQMRAAQMFSGKSEIVVPPPPPCLSTSLDCRKPGDVYNVTNCASDGEGKLL